MQLFIILALLLYGGKSGAQNLLSEVKPMLESFGGEEVQKALKSAEEISQVLSAVQAFAPQTQPQDEKPRHTSGSTASSPAIAFPLSPISDIADREITYSLSKYISQN